MSKTLNKTDVKFALECESMIASLATDNNLFSYRMAFESALNPAFEVYKAEGMDAYPPSSEEEHNEMGNHTSAARTSKLKTVLAAIKKWITVTAPNFIMNFVKKIIDRVGGNKMTTEAKGKLETSLSNIRQIAGQMVSSEINNLGAGISKIDKVVEDAQNYAHPEAAKKSLVETRSVINTAKKSMDDMIKSINDANKIAESKKDEATIIRLMGLGPKLLAAQSKIITAYTTGVKISKPEKEQKKKPATAAAT